jgi:Glu-tRNA(Gln) amidotransferase subunit E-like FAD-binding protein
MDLIVEPVLVSNQLDLEKQNHLLKLANIGNIKKEKALEMIHQVLKATQKWHECADKAGVSRVQTQNIAKCLARVHKNNLMKD